MLQLFSGGAATVPRDCVFTFVGLISALQVPEFIGYSQSLQGVYKNVVGGRRPDRNIRPERGAKLPLHLKDLTFHQPARAEA